MRRLLLLRHAKSSWSDATVGDHDRPLNERGRQAAAAMGDALRAEALVPDLVLCSSARRTCETAARLALPEATAIEIEHDLYLADPHTLLERVRRVGDGVQTLMVVGHNPTIHDVALELAGDGDPAALAAIAQKFPTGALAVLRVDTGWRGLQPDGAFLERFLTPRGLG